MYMDDRVSMPLASSCLWYWWSYSMPLPYHSRPLNLSYLSCIIRCFSFWVHTLLAVAIFVFPLHLPKHNIIMCRNGIHAVGSIPLLIPFRFLVSTYILWSVYPSGLWYMFPCWFLHSLLLGEYYCIHVQGFILFVVKLYFSTKTFEWC